MSDAESPSPNNPWRTAALILLPILGIVLAIAIAWLVQKPKDNNKVAVILSGDQAAVEINTGDIIDATGAAGGIVPRLGYRYKVFVDDESDDRSSGIAKIGGLVTFIPGARRGQTAIIDITRVRERVADGLLVSVLSEVDLPPKMPRAPYVPPPGDASAHVITGAEMDVIITEASSKNPETEGVAKVGGLVVFVNGVTTIGQRVNVRITERRERVAFAEPTGKPAGTEPLPTGEVIRRAFTPRAGDPAGHVVAGAEIDVVIAEASKMNPATEGVAKVNGLVVFVEGATNLGERVNIRITARRERMAFAERTGNPAGTGPLPEAAPAPARPPRAFTPRSGDPAGHVVAGAEMDVMIAEASSKNPATEGVAKVNGLVVFVTGATTIGERVNVRITERRERVAFAVPTGNPAGTGPLPEAAPAPFAPRAYVPGPGDSAPNLVPGAVVATTIVEPSNKNPTTEGVAKVDGFVVFVKGATTPGQAVNVRITDRRRTVAMGEVTTDPATVVPASPPPDAAPNP